MNVNFYSDQDFNGLEVGITLAPTKGAPVPVYIPSLIPYIAGGDPFSGTASKPSSSNILNSNGKSGISGYSVSNFVTLNVPKFILHEFPIKYCNGSCKSSPHFGCDYSGNIEIDWEIPKGTQLIIGFPGGEINKPRIIGVY